MKIIKCCTLALALLVSPTIVQAGELSTGYSHTLIVENGKDVVGMGRTSSGELGPNVPKVARYGTGMSPVHIGIYALDVASTIFRSAAVLPDKSVVMWGDTINRSRSSTPIVIGQFTNAARVEMTLFYLYVIDDNGDVFEMSYDTGVFRKLNVANIKSMSAGLYQLLMLDASGSVYAMGNNPFGELCVGDTVAHTEPTFTGITNAVYVSAGQSHSVITLSDKTAVACGNNGYNKLGDSSGISSSSPVAMTILNGLPIIQAEATSSGTFLLAFDNTVYAFGLHKYINNTVFELSTTEIVQIAELSEIVEISGGFHHVMFKDAYGNVTGFGGNKTGKLGDGTDTDRSTPVALNTPYDAHLPALVAPAPTIKSVTPGGSYVITGTDFGADVGVVTINGLELKVKSWTVDTIHVFNPPVYVSGTMVVTDAKGETSNEFFITLEADVTTTYGCKDLGTIAEFVSATNPTSFDGIKHMRKANRKVARLGKVCDRVNRLETKLTFIKPGKRGDRKILKIGRKLMMLDSKVTKIVALVNGHVYNATNVHVHNVKRHDTRDNDHGKKHKAKRHDNDHGKKHKAKRHDNDHGKKHEEKHDKKDD